MHSPSVREVLGHCSNCKQEQAEGEYFFLVILNDVYILLESHIGKGFKRRRLIVSSLTSNPISASLGKTVKRQMIKAASEDSLLLSRVFLGLFQGEFRQVVFFGTLTVFHLIIDQGAENKGEKVDQAFEFIVHDLGFVWNYKLGNDLPLSNRML